MTKESAPREMTELTTCKCKVSRCASDVCVCRKVSLCCTTVCLCEGDDEVCENSWRQDEYDSYEDEPDSD